MRWLLVATLAAAGCQSLLGLEEVSYREPAAGGGGVGGSSEAGGAGAEAPALTGDPLWLYTLDDVDAKAPGAEQRAEFGRFTASGNVVLAARLDGTAALTPPSQNQGAPDAALITLNGVSGEQMRQRTFGDEEPISVEIAILENDVFGLGDYVGSNVNVGQPLPAPCTPTLEEPSCATDLFTLKYDDDLDWRWSRSDGAEALGEIAAAITSVEPDGVIVGAIYSGPVTLYGESLSHEGGQDSVVVRLRDRDVSGTSRQWTTPLAGPADERVVEIAASPRRVGVLLAADDGEGRDMVVTSLDASDGSVHFSKTFSGQLNPRGIAMGEDDSLVVTATLVESSVTPDGDTLTPSGAVDLLLLGLDADGEITLLEQRPVSTLLPAARVAVDHRGHLVIGGSFEGTLDLGEGHLLEAGEARLGFVAKLDALGAPLWSRLLAPPEGATGDSLVADVDVLPNRGVLVTGGFRGTISFGLRQATSVASDAMTPGAGDYGLFALRLAP